MRYFAGLDVSLEETAMEETAICIVEGSGEIVKEFPAPSEAAALINALRQLDPPLERVGLGGVLAEFVAA